MSTFNQQLLAAKKQQRQRHIRLFVWFIMSTLVVIIAMLVSQGSRIEIQPDEAAESASVRVHKGFALIIGETLYSISRKPSINVSADGFKSVVQTLTNHDFGTVISITLEPLPATLALSTDINDDNTRWLINDHIIKTAAIFEYVLEAGDYQLTVSHPYYQLKTLALSLARGERFQKTISLTPVKGKLSIKTSPNGASIIINGANKGVSPLEIPLQGGHHELEIMLNNYQTINDTLEINYEQPTFHQHYPLELKKAEIKEMGDIEIESSPNAEVEINGKSMGITPMQLTLNAVEQIITLHKQGFQSVTKRVTPSASSTKKMNVTLLNKKTAQLKAAPPFYTHKAGGRLKLFTPNDTLIMGAQRSERGQRANEFIKKVRLSKAFYAGIHEVTYGEYQQFNSGKAGDSKKPVTSVSWVDASQFCNWLSQQEGLSPVYRINQQKLTGINTDTNGYRLLTEAEWEWLARKSGKPAQTVFVWNNDTIIPQDSANIADESAKGSVTSYVSKYNDGYPGVAPVMSFNQEKSGLYDQGGNVSEWTHDNYSIRPPQSGTVFNNPFSLIASHSHVIKGANWRSGTLTELRPSFRDGLVDARDDLGFRIGRYVYGGN